MATPIEDLHEFDLHIYVGSRSWPDDIELYCDVTYPGLDKEHPIHVNYLANGPYHLEDAIKHAVADIAKYMDSPSLWIEEHIKHKGSVWEKQHQLQAEIDEYQSEIARYERTIERNKERIAQAEQQLKEIPE